MTRLFLLSLVLLLTNCVFINAFIVRQNHEKSSRVLQKSSLTFLPKKKKMIVLNDGTESITTGREKSPSEMKIREMQSELKDMGIRYDDCFDRDSLMKRLSDGRDGCMEESDDAVSADVAGVADVESIDGSNTTHASEEDGMNSSNKASPARKGKFDRESTTKELRKLRVSELRSRLGERNIRWAGMIEKDDLIRSLVDSMERSDQFCRSGVLEAGNVVDISDEVLSMELMNDDDGTYPPLLLDVYATWCGPCQLMSPQLAEAARELGEEVRVAKIDSDKYSEFAGRLKVGGLPTVIVFDGKDGRELERVEGALMKDGLVDMARRHLS